MTIEDEVFERLKNGELLAQIRINYRSSSQVTQGFRKYSVWLEQEIQRKRVVLADVEEKNKKEAVLHEQLSLAYSKLSKEAKALREENEDLQENLERSRKRLEDRRSDQSELLAKGFTDEMVAKIRECDKRGPEVWEILQEEGKAQKLRIENAAALKTRDTIAKETSFVKTEKEQMEKEFTLELNKLIIAREKVEAIQELADLLNLAAKEGFPQPQLEAVQLKLRSPGMPQTFANSVSQMLPVLAQAQNLVNLKREFNVADMRLTEVLRLEVEAKARLETIQNSALKMMEDAKKALEKAIADVIWPAISTVSGVLSGFEAKLNLLVADARKSVNLSTEDLAKLQQQVGELRSLILPAQFFAGILESTDSLKLVSLPLIIQLLGKIRWWIECSLPSTLFGVGFNSNNEIQYSLIPFNFVTISSLVKLSIEMLEKQATQNRG